MKQKIIKIAGIFALCLIVLNVSAAAEMPGKKESNFPDLSLSDESITYLKNNSVTKHKLKEDYDLYSLFLTGIVPSAFKGNVQVIKEKTFKKNDDERRKVVKNYLNLVAKNLFLLREKSARFAVKHKDGTLISSIKDFYTNDKNDPDGYNKIAAQLNFIVLNLSEEDMKDRELAEYAKEIADYIWAELVFIKQINEDERPKWTGIFIQAFLILNSLLNTVK